jgi:hypothetical protein
VVTRVACHVFGSESIQKGLTTVDDDEREQPEPGPVTVRVALERPGWTDPGELTEIAAEDMLAAAQWDERCWRRG